MAELLFQKLLQKMCENVIYLIRYFGAKTFNEDPSKKNRLNILRQSCVAYRIHTDGTQVKIAQTTQLAVALTR